MTNITYNKVLVESKVSIGNGTGVNNLIVSKADFVAPAAGNYRLKSRSKAIAQGDSIGLWPYKVDFGGNSRIVGTKID